MAGCVIEKKENVEGNPFPLAEGLHFRDEALDEPILKNLACNPRLPVALPDDWQAGLYHSFECSWVLGVVDEERLYSTVPCSI